VKVTSDVGELESTIAELGFYVDSRLRKSSDHGHWLTSEHYVIDDVASPGRAVVHPCFADASNNAVFHSLAEVTHVLTQLQVSVATVPRKVINCMRSIIT